MRAHRTPFAAAAFGLVALAEAIVFLLFAAAHLGRPLVLGPLRLEEPPVPTATLVEGLCGIALLAAAHALLGGRDGRWRTALRAHALALAGVLVDMGALELGLGPRTAMGDAFHRGMLALLSAGLVLSLAAWWWTGRRRGVRWRRAPA